MDILRQTCHGAKQACIRWASDARLQQGQGDLGRKDEVRSWQGFALQQQGQEGDGLDGLAQALHSAQTSQACQVKLQHMQRAEWAYAFVKSVYDPVGSLQCWHALRWKLCRLQQDHPRLRKAAQQ